MNMNQERPNQDKSNLWADVTVNIGGKPIKNIKGVIMIKKGAGLKFSESMKDEIKRLGIIPDALE